MFDCEFLVSPLRMLITDISGCLTIYDIVRVTEIIARKPDNKINTLNFFNFSCYRQVTNEIQFMVNGSFHRTNLYKSSINSKAQQTINISYYQTN